MGADDIPEIGETIGGKFRIEGVLGVGGMGAVLEATHLLLKQRVAIKFLQPGLAQQKDLIARFIGEARIASTIRSEHVARVLDIAVLEGGTPYIVMELLPGVDLGELIHSRGKLPVEEAAGYVLQACEAIAEAHKLGFVHRDLKPSNLFLTTRADGSPLVKVFDFGISKSLHPRTTRLARSAADVETEVTTTRTITETGAVLGSLLYMSPEQLLDSKRVDERTDVWAIGAILYELLSGAPPFAGESVVSVLARMTVETPTPLRGARPDVPEALDTLILRCLEKNVDARVADVAELAEALEPFAPASSASSVRRIVKVLRDEAKIPARTVIAVDTPAALARTVRAMRTGQGRRGGPPRVGAAAGLAGLLAGMVIGLSLRSRSAPPAPTSTAAPTVAQTSPRTTQSAYEAAPAPPSGSAPVASSLSPGPTASASPPAGAPGKPPRRAPGPPTRVSPPSTSGAEPPPAPLPPPAPPPSPPVARPPRPGDNVDI